MNWQPIETAPKDKTILLYGPQVGGSKDDLAGWDGNIVASGYYDGIDTSWCVTGSTWRGPFIGATHWMPLPAPPDSNGGAKQ
ncbi:hypothetical protein V1290_000081 [Bradyrhizobium sp. AZCC 1578]